MNMLKPPDLVAIDLCELLKLILSISSIELIMTDLKWRIGRVVEGGGFENRCAFCVPGVRIPHSPPHWRRG